MIEVFGHRVLRSIPPEVSQGLVSGMYKLYGGAIRWAPVTAKGGQIVCLLVPTKSFVNSLEGTAPALFANVGNVYSSFNKTSLKADQIFNVSQEILSISKSAMISSGLNLVFSAIGFAYVSDRLNKIDKKLDEVQKDIREIKAFLESKEHAELRAALNDLLKLTSIKDLETRKTVLHTARQSLSIISERYREQLADAENLQKTIINEEYYCLTSYARMHCSAELNMQETVVGEIDEMIKFWDTKIRQVTKKDILRSNAERFLYNEYVNDVPVETLVELLDFAGDEKKGYKWIDELRRKNKSWYPENYYHSPLDGERGNLSAEKWLTFPVIQKILARRNVLEGHRSQIEFLAMNKITPTEFEEKISGLVKDEGDDFIILGPSAGASPRSANQRV